MDPIRGDEDARRRIVRIAGLLGVTDVVRGVIERALTSVRKDQRHTQEAILLCERFGPQYPDGTYTAETQHEVIQEKLGKLLRLGQMEELLEAFRYLDDAQLAKEVGSWIASKAGGT